MQVLRLLKIPSLSDTVLKSLSQNKITTVLDFLDVDVIKLSAVMKVDLSEVLAIRNEIFTRFSAPLVNGTEMLIKTHYKQNRLNIGINGLNTILDGGIPTGYITELCGLADSGKTQLCFQIAINCVKESDSNVLYVDTKGDFSAIRVQKILDASGYSPKEMAQIMIKIRVVQIWTIEGLIELFKSLKNKTVVIDSLALIIIDSLPCLMFQHLGEDHKMGLTFLNSFVNYCRYLSKDLNIGVICVNIQTRWVDSDVADIDDEADTSDKEPLHVEKRNRCLGKYWQHIPALVILLEKNVDSDGRDECSKIDVTVLKSNYLTDFSCQCSLFISGLGVT